MAAAPPANEDTGVARVNFDAAPSPVATVPVVISCATTAYEVVAAAAKALSTRGHAVEVVSGADTDQIRLAAAVARFERQGLYVLCRSGTLDRGAVDRLRNVLRNSEVPFGRTLTLALEPGGARGLEERIVSVARRMVTGSAAAQRRTGSLPPPPTTRKGVPQQVDPSFDAVPSPAPAVQQSPVEEEEVDAWADSLAGAKRSDLAGGDVDTSVDKASADPIATGGLGAPEAAQEAPSEALRTVPKDELTQPGAELSELEAASALDEEEPSTIPLSRSDFADGPPSGVDTTQVTRAPTPPNEHSGAEALGQQANTDDDIDVSEFGTGSRTMLYVGVGVTALLLVILVAVLASGGDDEADAKEKVAAKAALADKEKPEEKPEAKAEPKPEPEPAEAEPAPGDPAEGGEEPTPDAEPKPEPEPPAAKPPEPKPEPEPEPQPAAAVPEPTEPGRQPAPDPEPDPGLAPGPAEIEESAAVLAALRGRQIRAWNTYLIADEETKPTTFAKANAYCEGLKIGDLSGWRLPTIGELNSLNGAKMVRIGVYWSTTPGDAFGDTQMVVNAKKGTNAAARADWDGGKGICIRVRP